MKAMKQLVAFAVLLSSVSVFAEESAVMVEESALEAGGNAQGLGLGMQALIGIGSAVILTGIVVSEGGSDDDTTASTLTGTP